MIRAKTTKTGYCPIVGVGRMAGAHSHNYQSCADFLGLSDRQTERIINAADGYAPNTALRRNLLKSLGLKEATR